MSVIHESGQRESIFSKIPELLTITDGKFDFPLDNIVNLTGVYPFMDVNNYVYVNVSTKEQGSKGDILLSPELKREIDSLCVELCNQFDKKDKINYKVRTISFMCGETIIS